MCLCILQPLKCVIAIYSCHSVCYFSFDTSKCDSSMLQALYCDCVKLNDFIICGVYYWRRWPFKPPPPPPPPRSPFERLKRHCLNFSTLQLPWWTPVTSCLLYLSHHVFYTCHTISSMPVASCLLYLSHHVFYAYHIMFSMPITSGLLCLSHHVFYTCLIMSSIPVTSCLLPSRRVSVARWPSQHPRSPSFRLRDQQVGALSGTRADCHRLVCGWRQRLRSSVLQWTGQYRP